MKSPSIIFLLLLCSSLTVTAQVDRIPDFVWHIAPLQPISHFGGITVLDNSNNLITLGIDTEYPSTTRALALAKYSPEGDSLFHIILDNLVWPSPHNIVVDSQNNIYFSIVSNEFGVFYKYDSTGHKIWKITFDRDLFFKDNYIIDSKDDLIFHSKDNNIVKVSGDDISDTLWTFPYQLKYDQYVESSQFVTDSEDAIYVIVNESCWSVYLYCNSNSLKKIDSNGKMIWRKDFFAHAGINLVVDHEDNPIFHVAEGFSFHRIYKFNSQADSLWAIDIDDLYTSGGETVQVQWYDVDSENNIVLKSRFSPSLSGPNFQAMIKLSPDGELQWINVDQDLPHEVFIVDPEGNIYITSNREAFTISKYSSEGVLIWEESLDQLVSTFASVSQILTNDFESFFLRGTYWIDGERNSFAARFNYNKGVSIDEPIDDLPAKLLLAQNYPNPFNPVTSIAFTIPESDYISLRVYNSVGVLVATLYEGIISSGSHQINFDGSHLASGIYLYVLRSTTGFEARKALLVK